MSWKRFLPLVLFLALLLTGLIFTRGVDARTVEDDAPTAQAKLEPTGAVGGQYEHVAGTITLTQTGPDTVKITGTISGLEQAKTMHGFHVHAGSGCGNKGADAKGHYDPDATKKHGGPKEGEKVVEHHGNHAGDLGNVTAENGEAKVSISVKATLKELLDKTFILHQKKDTLQDIENGTGGAGPRIACGVIKATK